MWKVYLYVQSYFLLLFLGLFPFTSPVSIIFLGILFTLFVSFVNVGKCEPILAILKKHAFVTQYSFYHVLIFPLSNIKKCGHMRIFSTLIWLGSSPCSWNLLPGIVIYIRSLLVFCNLYFPLFFVFDIIVHALFITFIFI